jgi:hypothetical protein
LRRRWRSLGWSLRNLWRRLCDAISVHVERRQREQADDQNATQSKNVPVSDKLPNTGSAFLSHCRLPDFYSFSDSIVTHDCDRISAA